MVILTCMDAFQISLSICAGIALSAACGFRVFVPLLCLSIASYTGHLHLTESFAWVGSLPALIVFSVATVLEVAAYYIPFLDNLLDTIAAPTAMICGTIATASVVTDIPPFWRWILAVIAGGGAATTTQLVTTKLRAMSSATTGGIGNPVLSTAELGTASVLSVLAVIWPIAAIALTVLILGICALVIYFVGKHVVRHFRKMKHHAA
jgi:hypothetical protein